MQTSFKPLVRNAKRLAGTALVMGSLLLSGWASATTGATSTNAAPLVRADVIYVYSFDATPGQVKMDSGMGQTLKTAMSGESSAQKQSQTAADTREQVADEIVRRQASSSDFDRSRRRQERSGGVGPDPVQARRRRADALAKLLRRRR
jgi:hypothetical protein